MLTYVKVGATGHRRLAKLASFEFEIKYKRGKTNINADSLSQILETFVEVTKAICYSIDMEYGFSSCMSMFSDVVKESEPSPNFVDEIDIANLQLDHPDIAEIIEWKKRSYIPSESKLKLMTHIIVYLVRDLDKFSLEKDVLIKSVHNEIRTIVVPKSCVNTALRELHGNIVHHDRDGTLSLIQRILYCPGYTRDVENHVKHCFRYFCISHCTYCYFSTP